MSAQAGGETVGHAEMRVERPMQMAAPLELVQVDAPSTASDEELAQDSAILTAGDAALPEEAKDEAEAEADPAAAAAQAYQDACMIAGTPEGKCKRVLAARAWKAADPMNPEAELAIYLSLHEGGLMARARSLSRGFLTRFPQQVEVFLDHAKRWN